MFGKLDDNPLTQMALMVTAINAVTLAQLGYLFTTMAVIQHMWGYPDIRSDDDE